MSLRLVFSPLSQADIVDVLEWSEDHFGAAVRDGYEELLNTAFEDIRQDPWLAGSHERPELGRLTRGMHLRSSRDRVPSQVRRILDPRHVVFYRAQDDTVHVSRILHESRNFVENQFP